MESKKLKEIILTKEDDIHIMFFIDKNEEDESLMLQFQKDLSDEDIKMGWSKYYLSYADGRCGNYSCIYSIKLTENFISIFLNDLGKETFNVSEINLELKEGITNDVSCFLRERFLEENVILIGNGAN